MIEPGVSPQHASAVVIGEGAVLMKGAAGSGKSALVVDLLAFAAARGLFARLVADDRVLLRARGGQLLVKPHPAIAGLIERRGLGLTPLVHEACAVVRLVVERMAEPPQRLPEPADLVTVIEGITLPRLAIPAGPERGHGHEGLVLAALVLMAEAAPDQRI